MRKNTMGFMVPEAAPPTSASSVLSEYRLDELERTERKRILRALESIVREKLSRAWKNAVDSFGEAILLFAPRTEAERAEEFSEWLAGYRRQFVERLAAELNGEFEELYEQPVDWTEEAEQLTEQVWPSLADKLRRFGLRALATRWAARQYPDSIGVYDPQPTDYGWRLPLKLLRQDTEEEIGQIGLDATGNVLTEHTTKREVVRETLGRAG